VGFDATANTASFEPSPNLNPNSGSLVLNSGCLCGMRKNGGAATKSSGKVWGGTIFRLGAVASRAGQITPACSGILPSLDDP
jgi:hypothetical protein